MKRLKICTQQPKTSENTNIADIKSDTIEHSKNFRKLSKAVRQTEKVSQVIDAGKNCFNSLYTEAKKVKHF